YRFGFTVGFVVGLLLTARYLGYGGPYLDAITAETISKIVGAVDALSIAVAILEAWTERMVGHTTFKGLVYGISAGSGLVLVYRFGYLLPTPTNSTLPNPSNTTESQFQWFRL